MVFSLIFFISLACITLRFGSLVTEL